MAHVKVTAAGEHGAHARLGHGEFFGRFQAEAEVGGFSLAHVSADPRTDVQRHTHDVAHFIFVTRGIYVTGAKGAANLIYNPPGTTHRDRFRRSDDGGFDGRFLSISIDAARMKSIRDGLTLAERSIGIAAPAAAALAKRLIAEMERWEPASRLVAEGICLELAAEVARRDPFGERMPPRWLRIAGELLRERGADCSVSEIANECGVHPVHLARTFRRFFGCSPGAYLRRCRIDRAASLLRDRSLPLTEVALRAGFADQSHMTRAFRQALAMTPAAFRRDDDVATVQDDAAGPV